MSENVIDLKEFLERVQDDKELLLELLDIYTDDYLEKRKLLSRYIQEKDFELVKTTAHSLKGASGNISAKTLRELFLVLEQQAQDLDGARLEEILSDVDHAFAELRKRIAEIKEEL
ncbi:MAG: Hpt domain-containing protein [Candidatus Omnitrophica bacterium]|nr:Hpt domain-containing protein [Candidatus Omnitrophota bacterium]